MAVSDDTVFGDPCWIDLMTSDVAKAREFYSSLFAWEAGEPSEEFGGYFMFMRDGQPVAGGMGIPEPGSMADMWNTYFAVEDATDSVARAQAAGALVVAPTVQVGDLGTMAVLLDPAGVGFGLWAPIGFQGFAVTDEANAPGWFEQHSRGYEASVAFYRELFDWETRAMSDTPELRYTTVNHGEEGFAGIFDASSQLAEGVPGQWQVYFRVDNVDRAVATTLELGGAVLELAQDTPFGRLATLADSTGASFAIMQ